ncbi:MAG TPA: 2-hydroxy-3-oxopropionate reductase [Acetobacteraceae bacterium]|nr:2-hydroxy-3-oxopropionate reductase [Acetobacteraceae bacterium]
MRIGFIGLGIMGRPMALNLAEGGHTLIVPERKSLSAEMRRDATVVADAKSVAAGAEIVILMVPDTPDVEQALFGPAGAAEGLKPGTLVIDMSSISPIATRDFAARINARGCDYLDAPVSGGEMGAKQASLTIMVGGPGAAFAKALPLFQLMGKSITHVGEKNGAGQICKVANQIIVACNIQAAAEALVFAAKAGADPAVVRKAILGGFAGSRVLDVHGERMLTRAFAPGFRIRLHEKDLSLALGAARELGLALPSTALAQQMFQAAAANGAAESDHSALVTAVELLADQRLGG